MAVGIFGGGERKNKKEEEEKKEERRVKTNLLAFFFLENIFAKAVTKFRILVQASLLEFYRISIYATL